VVLLEYDETKSARNERERGIGFDRFSSMDLTVSVASDDDRRDYGETRTRLVGPIDGHLHVAIITRREDRLRVISLRRANDREERAYEEARKRAGQREPGVD
jgi:uncharacterized DUF497 family protein